MFSMMEERHFDEVYMKTRTIFLSDCNTWVGCTGHATIAMLRWTRPSEAVNEMATAAQTDANEAAALNVKGKKKKISARRS